MNLADRLEAHARERPHAVAVAEGDRSMDYAALDRAVWRATDWLHACGVAEGDVAVLCMHSGALRLVLGFALARLGAVQVSLARNVAPHSNEDFARRHQARFLIADGGPDLGLRRLEPPPQLLQEAERTGKARRSGGGDRWWAITRTSGTTGLPKAVAQSHATFAARREFARGPGSIEASDRFYSALSMEFALGWKLCLDALWVGAAVMVGGRHTEPGSVLAEMERFGTTYVYLTPSHLHALLPALPPDRHRLPGLRVLRSGSMPISEPVRRKILSGLTPNLLLSYGVNDIDCGVTQADAAAQERHPGSVGAARPGVELQVVDADGRVLAAGETGEVRIRIPDMPSGYLDDPAGSARSFRNGWFHPGDLASLSAEGMLTLKGRTDDLINFQGVKILPAEIEEVLSAHPDVAEAAAFPVRTERDNEVPAAAVVLRGARDLDSLRRWIAERLLGARSPQVLLVLKAMPRNDAGKVLKTRLAELALKQLEARK